MGVGGDNPPQGWADGDRVGTDAMGMPSRSRCSSRGGRSMTDAVPEADALEQAMPVPFDEDDAPR